jgi:hypothetical protein
MDDGVEVELTGAEVRDDTLYLDFAVRNESPRTVELGGRLPRAGLHTSLTPQSVLLVRRPFGDGPKTLAPGARYEETLELPLPVPPRHPIAPQPEGPLHEVAQVALALDYSLGGDDRIKTVGPAEAVITTTISAP